MGQAGLFSSTTTLPRKEMLIIDWPAPGISRRYVFPYSVAECLMRVMDLTHHMQQLSASRLCRRFGQMKIRLVKRFSLEIWMATCDSCTSLESWVMFTTTA